MRRLSKLQRGFECGHLAQENRYCTSTTNQTAKMAEPGVVL
jgi:hypothetical protein